MTRVSLAILIGASLIAWAIANVDAPPARELAPTASGNVDRTNRTDRLKAPAPELRVASECRSA